ncbi:alcohol oxidase [Thozetella sp. PMI_491]|nr:alcohol oxidase [Thozetella sp. PMI_491]
MGALKRACKVLFAISNLQVALSYPQLQNQFRRREVGANNLENEYDYIVVGGGQAGLVVANRLSEDPGASVLIIEHGYFDDTDTLLQPQSAVKYPPQNLYNLTSVPQIGLLNRTQNVYSAYVVGGGSAINGMMLNRGSARDYDNWERLENPGWGWNDLLPYFVKSTTLQAPSPQLQEDFNITWNASSYGTGPIHVSYAPFQWPGTKVQYKGLVEAGAVPQLDGADGHAWGVFWFTSAIDNTTITRSYARNRYYDPVMNRTNLHIITGWRVNDIMFNEHKHATGIRMQERGTANGQDTTTVKSKREIILAAGSLHSPQVLQRSGIGPQWLLDQANIDVLVDLPGVGSNLQDHPASRTTFNYTTNVEPNSNTASWNATFAQWVQDEWNSYRRGPMSQTVGNVAGLLPLKVTSPDAWEKIVEEYRSQEAGQYLPSHYSSEQIAGYAAQREILSDAMSSDDSAVLEYPFNGAGSASLVVIKGVSRGTVLLNTTDIWAEPVLDYRTFSNPVDIEVQIESVKWTRRLHQTASMQTLGPVELVPGPNITSEEALIQLERNTSSSTTAHLSGTCAMMPQYLGGVVDSQLLVYGVTGLSVADSSIMPLIPGAHLCATVYAVAEKAADLIKARHGSK